MTIGANGARGVHSAEHPVNDGLVSVPGGWGGCAGEMRAV